MRCSRPIILSAIIVALHAAQPARSQAVDGTAADRHRRIDAIFAPPAGSAAPGCAVAVSRGGVLDHTRGYGLSNLEHAVPITPASVFLAGSISKQFTAFAVGLLAQEGRLSLDDDIRRHVPEMPDFGRIITVAHLIHHTNGLREQGQLLNMAGWRGDDVYTEEDVLQALRRQRQLNFEPGTEIVYGNAAYTLLGVIVRRVSGQSLRAFSDSRIFRPLGMADTRFRDDHTMVVPRRAAAYRARPGGGWSESMPAYDHYGSTGVYTTVGDLLKWQANLIDGRVGGAALAGWMRTSGRLNDGTRTGYGGGLRLGDYRGLAIVSHDGSDGGYRAEAALFPDQRLAIVALCNDAGIDATALTRRVADLYLADRMTGPALAPAIEEAGDRPANLAGSYWSPTTGEVVQIEWKDGALRQAGSPAPFVAIGAGVYRPAELAHEWRFVPPPADAPPGTAAELQIRDSWPTFRVFHRIVAPLPDVGALSAFVGRYRSEETETTYSVRLSDGRLSLSWPRGYDMALDAAGGDHFVGARGTITFVRTASGEVGGLTISNRRLRRLPAHRMPG